MKHSEADTRQCSTKISSETSALKAILKFQNHSNISVIERPLVGKAFLFLEYQSVRLLKIEAATTGALSKKGVLRNFAKFTGKHLRQSLFFNKVTLARVFSCKFCEISKNTFLTEHLWTTASLKKSKL